MILYILLAAALLPAAALVGPSAPVRTKSGIWSRSLTRGAARSKAAMLVLFLVLCFPAVIRQEVGNDYMRYVAFMHLANCYEVVPTEPGFNFLVRVIYGLCGYENSLLVFAVFAVVTIAVFLAAIRMQAKNFLFSFFLFMTLGYYFQTYNTVRYYFALSLALFSLYFLMKREYVPFVGLILFAALFHKSVLVVLVLYPLCLHRWKKWQLGGLAVLAAFLSVFRSFWMKVLVMLYPSYKGTGFLEGGSPSPVNIVRCAAVLLLAFAVARAVKKAPSRQAEDPELSRKQNFRFNCTYLAFLLYVFAYFVPELSRICYFLTITQLFYIPALLGEIPHAGNVCTAAQQGFVKTLQAFGAKVRYDRRTRLTVLVCAAAVLYFMAFLYKAYDTDVNLLPYKTFFFHDLSEAIIE